MKNLLILFIIPGILIGYYLIVTRFLPSLESRGQFGDMFGAVNALFSGFAFLGIIYTIYLQRNELALQRDELRLTRQELTRTAEAQEKSEKALSKQAASLKVTAKLNGLSARLQHHNSLIEVSNSARYGIDTTMFSENKQKAEDIIRQIEDIIEEK
jgi:hypothetical protein